MHRTVLIAAAIFAAGPVAAQQVTPNAGPVHGEGSFTDSDGNPGTWTVEATLAQGKFTGTGTVQVAGVTVAGKLDPGQSYLENGKCYFEIVEGRTHFEVGGPCTATSIEGRVGGFIVGPGTINGTHRGTLRFGKPLAAAPAAGILPTAKLTCAWMERIGGNVAGDLARYELRFSNMATLTLSPDGSYRTANTSGRFARRGATIRLTSGQFAGAVGRLQPDRSGAPAVYFEIDENRRPDGVHIVDPARTSCTVARGG